MATILNTLYPPLIDTFMPAFPNTDMAVAHFTVSPYNSPYDIQYLHVTLVNQKTNKNAFSTEANTETPAGTALINGIWIVPFTESLNGEQNPYLDLDKINNYFTLRIPRGLLKSTGTTTEPVFNVNHYYKLQLRFDKYVSNDNSWSITQANSNYISEKRAYFSEWSSVCLLKAIPEITVHFNNFTYDPTNNYGASLPTALTNLPSNLVAPTRTPQYMPGIIPFAGNLTFAGANDNTIVNSANSQYYRRDIATTSNNEYLMSYRITVIDNLGNVIRDSGIQYPSKDEKTNTFYWLCDMTECTTGQDYTVTLDFTTNNQYNFSKNFTFSLIPPGITGFNPTISFNKIPLRAYGIEEEVLVTSEDGWVEITVENKGSFGQGYLFIKRATSLTDFKNWELIDCFFNESDENFSRTITDRTISSLVGYKYSCQYLTSKGMWTQTVISPEIIYPDFHDILLSREDKQLAVRYNPQIASLTPVVSRVKIDTLGGRYPKFAENAKVHYKQFQLSGLITAESDFNRTFLNDLDYNDEMSLYDEKMNGRYQIRNDTIREAEILYGIDEDGNKVPKRSGTYSAEVEAATTDTRVLMRDTQKNTKHDIYPKDNWWWERKFREEVMEWLNDGEPKLYRSMTEGNLIVMLDGITLTPNAQLGRRIWNFSCIVYEIGDGNSLEQLDVLGVYPIVNNYDASLTSEIGIITDSTRMRLGQTAHITAASDKGTNLVIPNPDDSSNGRGYISILNSKGQLDKRVEALSIGEEIASLYTGLYANYDFNQGSIRLRDLKIQFESLPQWYDLDSMSPQGYAIGGLYLTIQRGNELVDVVVKENNEGTYEIIDVVNNNLPWAQAGMTITQFLTTWEMQAGNLYYQIEDSDQHIYTAIPKDQYNQEEYRYYEFKNKDNSSTKYTKDNKNYISKAALKSGRYSLITENGNEIYIQINSSTPLPENPYIPSSDEEQTSSSPWEDYYILVDREKEEDEILEEEYQYVEVNKPNDNIQYKQFTVNKVDYYIEAKEKDQDDWSDIEKTIYYQGKDVNSEDDKYFEKDKIQFNKSKPVEYTKVTWLKEIEDIEEDSEEQPKYESYDSFFKTSELDDNIYKFIINPGIKEYEKRKAELKEDIDALNTVIDADNETLNNLLEKYSPEDSSSAVLPADQQQALTLYKSIQVQIEDIWSVYQKFTDYVEKEIIDIPTLEQKLTEWISEYYSAIENVEERQKLEKELKHSFENISGKNDKEIIDLFESKLSTYVYYKLVQQDYTFYRDNQGYENTKLITVINEIVNKNRLMEIPNLIDENKKPIVWSYAVYFTTDEPSKLILQKTRNELRSWTLEQLKSQRDSLTEEENNWNNAIPHSEEETQQHSKNMDLLGDINNELTWRENVGRTKTKEELNAELETLRAQMNDSALSDEDKAAIHAKLLAWEEELAWRESHDSSSSSTEEISIIDDQELQNIQSAMNLFNKIHENISLRDNKEFEWAEINRRLKHLQENHNSYYYSQTELKEILSGKSITEEGTNFMPLEIINPNNNSTNDHTEQDIRRSTFTYYKYKKMSAENEEDKFGYEFISDSTEITKETNYSSIYVWNNDLQYCISLEAITTLLNARECWIKQQSLENETFYYQVQDIDSGPFFLYNIDSNHNTFIVCDNTIIYYKLLDDSATNDNPDISESARYIKKEDWDANTIYYYLINNIPYQIGKDIEKDAIQKYYEKQEKIAEEDETGNIIYKVPIPLYRLIKEPEELNWETKSYYIKLLLTAEDIDNNYLKYEYKRLIDVLDTNELVYISSYNAYIPSNAISENPNSHVTIKEVLGPGNQLIRVNTDTGESLTVEPNDTDPENSTIDFVDAKIIDFINETSTKLYRNNYGLGYKLQLDLVSPHNPGETLTRTIFVNERGYYQVPSNMIIQEVRIFDDATATLDYILEYDLKYDDETEPNSYEVSENIVGQVSGEWDYNTSISPVIYQKYWAYDKSSTITTQQMVDYWQAISFDGTPYTVLNVQPTSSLNSTRYIVGRSGVLNLQTDYSTLNMYISGKRMVRAPMSRQPYLDEWEYVLDNSVFTGQQESESDNGVYWWVVYNNATTEETDIIVKIHIEQPEQSTEVIPIDENSNITLDVLDFDEDAARVIAKDWYELENTHYIVSEIINPQPNTVYGVINTTGVIEYKIYYLDRGWFNITFATDEENKIDYSIAYAQVPVYGMIDYRASINKKVWNQN